VHLKSVGDRREVRDYHVFSLQFEPFRLRSEDKQRFCGRAGIAAPQSGCIAIASTRSNSACPTRRGNCANFISNFRKRCSGKIDQYLLDDEFASQISQAASDRAHNMIAHISDGLRFVKISNGKTASATINNTVT